MIPGPTLHFCEVIRAGAGGSFLTEFQPLLGPPALPAARHSTLLASLHLTRETMSLRASCAANGTAIRQNAERHNGVRQAMGLEDAEASVSHEFDSCKRAGSLTSLPWRSRADTFATVTSGVEKLHVAIRCRSGTGTRPTRRVPGLTPSSSEGIPSQVVAAPVGFMKSVTGLRSFLIPALRHYS